MNKHLFWYVAQHTWSVVTETEILIPKSAIFTVIFTAFQLSETEIKTAFLSFHEEMGLIEEPCLK